MAVVVLASSACFANPSLAAAISDREFESLKAEAQKSGAAFVSVSVASVSLVDAMQDTSGRRSSRYEAMRTRAQTLQSTLGDEAWPFGKSDNFLGQFGMYLTPRGLDILRLSKDADQFRAHVPEQIQLLRAHPGFSRLEAELEQAGQVDALVTVRNQYAAYDIASNGQAVVTGGAQAVAEHGKAGNRIVAALRSADVSNLNAVRSGLEADARNSSLSSLHLRVSLNARAFLTLANHPDVASMQLQRESTGAKLIPVVDERLLAKAGQETASNVILLMRDPLPHWKFNQLEFERARDARSRVAQSLAQSYRLTSYLRAMPEIGAITARLTAAEIDRIVKSQDSRLTGIIADTVVGTPALNKSTSRMRMPLVWNADAPAYPNAGFRGAYPSVQNDPSSQHLPVYIVVMDSGTKIAHPMLAGRVLDTFSSCFGTFDGFNSSICPGALASVPSTWKTVNTPGSAAAPLGSSYCNLRTSFVSYCDHGTLVAGVAAGNQVLDDQGNTLSGVAPLAQVVPFQVFSWNLSQGGGPALFAGDLLAALQAVYNVSSVDPAQNFIVVNMSIGSPGTYLSSSCASGVAPFNQPSAPNQVTNDAFSSIVANLKSRGIPVIAATGNNGQANATEFPACLPGVIKAGGMLNPSDIANPQLSMALDMNRIYVNPAASPTGESFFLGSSGTNISPGSTVRSATANTTALYGGDVGTSLAAPHVAGAYAVVRAGYVKLGANQNFSVDAASNYLRLGLTGVDVPGPSIPGVSAPMYRAIRFDLVAP